MVMQNRNFYKSMGKKFNKVWKSQNSLFGIWMGSNDVRLVDGDDQTKHNLYNKALDKMSSILEDMYKNGARNFLIINIPPLETTPFSIKHNIDYVKKDADYFNSQLEYNMKLLSEKHEDINIFIYDVNKRFLDIVNNCNEYQFEDCKNAWVKTKQYPINKYLYSDMNHYTYKAYETFVSDIVDMLNV